MAGETTGLVIFSPRSINEEVRGLVGSRIWRPGFLGALVEKHIPMWVVTPIAHSAGDIPAHTMVYCNPDISGPLEMNLMPIMASLFSQSNQELKNQAKKENVLFEQNDKWWINSRSISLGMREEFDDEGELLDRIEEQEFVFPSGRIFEMSFEAVSSNARVTSLIYPHSQLTSQGVTWMRSLGIDVDEFVLKSAGVAD